MLNVWDAISLQAFPEPSVVYGEYIPTSKLRGDSEKDSGSLVHWHIEKEKGRRGMGGISSDIGVGGGGIDFTRPSISNDGWRERLLGVGGWLNR